MRQAYGSKSKNSNEVKFSHIVPLILKPISFLALHLALPTLQKSLNSMKKWVRYGVFGVKESSVQ